MRDGVLRNVSYEALSAARQVAEDGELLRHYLEAVSLIRREVLGDYGADTVYVVENEKLNQYTPTPYVQAFMQIINEVSPEVILMGHTGIGKIWRQELPRN